MGEIPKKAFILAAGFGTRMRPLTDNIPKPMVQLAGRSLIWHIFDKLRAVGVVNVIVNTHYLPEVLAAHTREYEEKYQGFNVHLSHEEEILDTGGGVKRALPYFQDEPFYVIAGDAYWEDPVGGSALAKLAQMWDFEKMDIATFMEPVQRMQLTKGVGDYNLQPEGRVLRSADKTGSYMWTNVRINSPKIYESHIDGAFSFLPIMDECQDNGRFYGFEMPGRWHHISTPEDLYAVDAYLKKEDRSAS